MLFHLNHKITFPDPSLADEDGLLAVGGDLSPERLQLAYRLGIFPWYSKEEPILWHSPQERFVLFPSRVHVSHRLRRFINSAKYEIRWNTAFDQVIRCCSAIERKGQRGTWINEDMIQAYLLLHDKKMAHSVETWQEDKLIGGMYGVVVNKVFCGESMFSKVPNASKLALIALCRSGNYELIDCQVYTPHLASMGAEFITREEFMNKLSAIK